MKSSLMTRGILNSINTKNMLCKIFIQADSQNVDTYNNCKQKCINYKATLRKSIHAAKRMYYLRLFTLHKNDIKKTWCLINSTITNKSKGKLHCEFDLDGKIIGIMYKARQFLTKKALLTCMLYHAYIFPYMTYCIEVWGCASQTQLNCLFLLQKKIIRIMNFSHYLAHTNPLFLTMEVLPLRKIFFYKVGLIMYSLNLLPECIAHLYLRNDSIHEHNTRGCHELRVLPGAKTFSKHKCTNLECS